MKITKQLEEKLKAQLDGEYTTIPLLQQNMSLKYTEAKILMEYAQARKWVGDCDSGIRYPICKDAPSPKTFGLKKCRELYDALGWLALKVLNYMLNNDAVSPDEISKGLNIDSEDTIDTLEALKAHDYIFCVRDKYYTNITVINKAQIEKFMLETSKVESNSAIRRLLEDW